MFYQGEPMEIAAFVVSVCAIALTIYQAYLSRQYN